MKVAIIGSRGITDLDISKYMPEGIDLIISGGARGVDTLAEKYADEHGIPKLIIRPDYDLYGRRAPLVRNKIIVDNADLVIAFWDGESRGTSYTVEYAIKQGVPRKLYMI